MGFVYYLGRIAMSEKAPKEKAVRVVKPGTKEKVPKPEKVKRIAYPGLKGADGKATKLQTAEIPTDFDSKKHLPLSRKDFAEEHLYFTLRAAQYMKQVKFFEAKAEDAKKTGNVADKARARRLLKMQEKMAELRAQLEGQGVDVDTLLSGTAAAATTAA
jgi:hypothetical protein